MSLNLAHYLEMSAAVNSARTAVILDDYRLTYAELMAYARRVANILKLKGIGPGDKVAMMIPNTPHFPVIYFGILLAGATVVPVNVLLKGAEVRRLLEDSDAKLLFAWKDFAHEAAKAVGNGTTCHNMVVVSRPDDFDAPPVGDAFMPLLMDASPDFDLVDTMPDDTAVILYTSGTTGQPKGAELTHFNMFFNAYYVKEKVLCAEPGDVVLAVLPLFHSFGQTCVQNATLMAGAAMTMMPRFDARKMVEVVNRDRVKTIAMVPSMYFFLLEEAERGECPIDTVQLAVSGGSALPLDIYEAFQDRFGIRILEGYGLSETSPVASFNVSGGLDKPGSIGLPIWGCEMRIMLDDGSFAEVNEVGEIVIRGHNVMKGYYKKPVANQETIVNGWLHTGDLGRFDEDGYFFIVDRKKEIIIRSGLNIYPREIEEQLHAHPAVVEAAVVGIPDRARGEEVKAFVVVKEGSSVSEEELATYCIERMAKYKCPRQFKIVASLPKGPTGKILKQQLRKGA